MSRLAAWAVVALVLPALAGCASKDAPSAEVQGGTTGSTRPDGATTSATAVAAEPPPISGTSARWHFHDYWHGHPTIVLVDTYANLSPNLGGLGSYVELPQGVLVPPETGLLSVNLSWADPGAGLVNLTYRPADSNDFFPTKDATSGHAVLIPTTESMCDVPHRQKSLWLFNLTAMPSQEVPPGFPATTIHVVISATIGRPLFIDPPHFNWWQGSDVIDLVKPVSGDLVTGTTAAGNATLPDAAGLVGAGLPPSQPRIVSAAQSANQSARIPVTAGRIVPEGAMTLVAIVNWTSSQPAAPKLKVTYEEQNAPSSGALPVSVDGDGSRIFVMPISPPQTDTTYSNRTTWQFHVLPDSDSAAFDGHYSFVAWVTRLSPAEAVKVAQGKA